MALRLPPLPLEQIDDSNRARIERLSGAAGVQHEHLLVMARIPGLLAGILDATAAVGGTPYDDGTSSVSRGLKYLVGAMVSRSAGCQYCWAHQGLFATEVGGVAPAKVAAIWEFEKNDLFSPAERAALRVAAAAGVTPSAVDDAMFVELRTYFSDDEVVEIVGVIAVFGFWNRWNETMASVLEDGPMRFGGQHLADSGWVPGKHAPAPPGEAAPQPAQ
jgi:alkylhydroperoxidase family enzyme